MPRQPTLRLHATGQYMTKMHGKCLYFGSDRAEAERRFAQTLLAYNAAKPPQPQRRSKASNSDRQGSTVGSNSRRRTKCLTVAEAAERLAKELAPELTEEGLRYHRKNLGRFCARFGVLPLDEISGRLVQEYRLELCAKYAPKTVNHTLTSLKRLLVHARDFGWVDKFDFEVGAIRMLPLEPPAPRAMTLKQAFDFIESVGRVDRVHPRSIRYKRRVALAMLLQLHLACRPSELVRLVNNEGEWIEPWAFRPTRSKTARRSRQHRYLVLSLRSRALLKLIHRPDACHQRRGRSRATWETYDAYGKAVSRLTGKPPHALRHTAATLLVRDGVSRTDVDEYLGHSVARTSLTYMPLEAQLESWRAIAERLAVIIQPEFTRFISRPYSSSVHESQ